MLEAGRWVISIFVSNMSRCQHIAEVPVLLNDARIKATCFIMFSVIDFEQSIMAVISQQVKEQSSSINVLTALTLILVDGIGVQSLH